MIYNQLRFQYAVGGFEMTNFAVTFKMKVTCLQFVIMNSGRYIFTQLCDFLPRRQFERYVAKYEGNKYVRSFSCWHHLLVMIFGQLSNRESLRDLVNTLEPYKSCFHHLGLGSSITRSNLSKANEIREVKIFEDMAELLIKNAQNKRRDIVDPYLDVNGKVYAFDSSTISLCLNTFWWSRLHHDKGAVKLHTMYDVTTNIPAFNIITNGNVHDSQVMHLIPYNKGDYYIFDRGYMDTKQLNLINKMESFFVVREKHKMKYIVETDKGYNNPNTGVMSDQYIRFAGQKSKKQYPNLMRRITFYDIDGNRTFVFYTNNFEISAEMIARLYKYRWRVELFFKWLKQHLRVKDFYGTSENAVKIQIYCAIISYCLVAIIEREMKIEISTYGILRVLSVSLLVKTPLRELLEKCRLEENNYQNDTQLNLNFL